MSTETIQQKHIKHFEGLVGCFALYMSEWPEL